ncbi:hypothetical protein ES708_11364 [subsurface metagenome]
MVFYLALSFEGEGDNRGEVNKQKKVSEDSNPRPLSHIPPVVPAALPFELPCGWFSCHGVAPCLFA